jgi:hypothetical protein
MDRQTDGCTDRQMDSDDRWMLLHALQLAAPRLLVTKAGDSCALLCLDCLSLFHKRLALSSHTLGLTERSQEKEKAGKRDFLVPWQGERNEILSFFHTMGADCAFFRTSQQGLDLRHPRRGDPDQTARDAVLSSSDHLLRILQHTD